mgnify:FL=1
MRFRIRSAKCKVQYEIRDAKYSGTQQCYPSSGTNVKCISNLVLYIEDPYMHEYISHNMVFV